MSNSSFTNKSIRTPIVSQQTYQNNNGWIQIHIIYPIEAFILPIFVFLSIFNNALILIIFISSKDVVKRIKSSIRVYYIATAIGDIIVCIPVHLTYFLGKLNLEIKLRRLKL